MIIKLAEIAKQITDTNNPAEQKRLSKKIKNLDIELWNQQKDNIMKRTITAKFTQNHELKNKLLATNNKVLIEGNPNDSHFGVALSIYDNDIWDETKWKGKNVLGYLLMELRNELREEIEIDS